MTNVSIQKIVARGKVKLNELLLRADIKFARARGKHPIILVSRPGAMGDIICTFPMLKALRQKHPKAYIVYGSVGVFLTLPKMSGLVDEVVDVDWRKRVPKIHEPDFDIIIRPLYGIEEPTSLPPVHIVDEFCRRQNIVPSDRQPHVTIAKQVQRRIGRQIQSLGNEESQAKRIIAIHTGPTWAVKTWPANNWDDLVQELKHKQNAIILQLGNDSHIDGGSDKTPRVVGANDWIGKHSIEETAAVLEQCDLFIGLDSGLIHLAGATGTSCVGLFGPTRAEFLMPPGTPSIALQAGVGCGGCHHRQPLLHWKTGCPHNVICMESISVQQVYSACASFLNQVGEHETDMGIRRTSA